jgi:hypothetical protein
LYVIINRLKLVFAIRADLEEVRLQVKKLTETKKEEKKRLADEDATRFGILAIFSNAVPVHAHTILQFFA